MKIIACFTTIFAVVAAKCPDLQPMDCFDVTRFTGTWYNQYSKNTPLEAGSCMVSEYTYDNITEAMAIDTSYKTIFGNFMTMAGTAVFINSTTEAKFDLIYRTPVGNLSFALSFLASDYENYAVMYSCMNILNIPYESSWILARKQVMDEETLEIIKKAMIDVHKNGGPSFSQMKKNSQKNCS